MTPTTHPVIQVLTAPEVAAAASGAVAALLGLLVMLIRSQTHRLEDRLHSLGIRTDEACNAADEARRGVTNEHGTHLRDDLDEVRDNLNTVLARLDTAETARQADVERSEEKLEIIARRVSRVETHADGLRADLRSLDARVARQEVRTTDCPNH